MTFRKSPSLGVPGTGVYSCASTSSPETDVLPWEDGPGGTADISEADFLWVWQCTCFLMINIINQIEHVIRDLGR